jgi:hypothetical protein
MTPRTLDVKFPCGTQLVFGSLSFAIGEDGELKMLPPGPAPEHLALASSAASSRSCSGSDPSVGSYIRTAKTVQVILVVTSILWSLAGASSSFTLASTPDPDSSDDYPEIRVSVCGEPVEGGRLICMVAPNGDGPNNTSSKYPTIGKSEASEVKLHHQQVQITVCPSMTRDGALLRTAPHRNTVVNGMTSATLLKIGGVSSLECRPHHDGLW